MNFLFPSLATGLVLVAVPLLVHLINLFRHRKQQWAAMEFLLMAYRKQRKWVVLRQLVLLALRTLGIAVLVAMLAGWISGARLLSVFGSSTHHHLVILDDSYSMEDRSAGVSAYQRAKTALEGFVQRISEDPSVHQLTILRTSRAALAVRSGVTSGDAVADMSGETIVAGERTLARILATTTSALDASLEPALQIAADLGKHSTADRTSLYLMTDLRVAQWQAPRRMAELLGTISKSGVEIKVIDCGVSPQTNLSVSELVPQGDVWAASVPSQVLLRVRNHGDQPVNDVSVSVSVIRFGSDAIPRAEQSTSGVVEPLPNVVFEQIEARSEATKVFQVFIPDPGTHVITARLPEDVVATDNFRVCTLPLVESRRLLIVEGDSGSNPSYFLRSAIDPGGAVRTGWSYDIRSPQFLNTASLDDLRGYSVIWLLDLPQLDPIVQRTLFNYVNKGGGLGIWCGPQSRVGSYNESIFGKDKLLPGSLSAATPIRPSARQALNLDQPHPITAPLAAVGPAMLSSVRVEQAFSWVPDDQVPATVLFRARDDRPLGIVHRIGEGRVLGMFTALDPKWTNWPADPTFVVFILRATAELSLGKQPPTSFRIGAPVQLIDASWGGDRSNRSAELYLPGLAQRSRSEVEFSLASDGGPAALLLDPAEMLSERREELPGLLTPGVGEVWTIGNDGKYSVVPFALVPEHMEGDLQRIERTALVQSLRPTALEILGPEALSAQTDSAASAVRTLFLLGLLAMILIVEQWAAYWASYHQPVLAGGRK